MHLRLPKFVLSFIYRWAEARSWPYRAIFNDDGSLYMQRNWVWKCGRGGVDDNGILQPWIGLRLHTIHTSDDGREPHDHPWSFITLPLTPRTGRRPELVVTTLFFQFPKRQSWGFLKDGKKVYWKTFLAQRNAEARATASPQQGA